MLTELYEKYYSEILSLYLPTKNLHTASRYHAGGLCACWLMPIPYWSDGTSVPPPLYKTAKNIFIDRVRRQRRESAAKIVEESTDDFSMLW